jgi:hypothetical protein
VFKKTSDVYWEDEVVQVQVVDEVVSGGGVTVKRRVGGLALLKLR